MVGLHPTIVNTSRWRKAFAPQTVTVKFTNGDISNLAAERHHMSDEEFIDLLQIVYKASAMDTMRDHVCP